MKLVLLFCFSWLLPFAGVAHGESIGETMVADAQRFLAALSPAELAKARLKFDDPSRLDWHNIPKPQRKGLQVRDMSAEQRRLCLALVRCALSDVGFEKAQRIMALEANLREGEKNLQDGPLRDPERYFLTIFGEPADTGTWGWSFEGHHFSLNFVIRDGKVVSDTPSFWVRQSGHSPHFCARRAVGQRTNVAREEQLALDLVGSLSASQLRKALIAAEAPKEYRAAGTPQPPPTPPEGLPASEMDDSQRSILWSLLEAYNGNLAPELAAERLAEVKAGGLERVYFAWAGATKPGVGHYYRVQGPAFVLELVNIQSDPAGNPANHIHSVWRNLNGDFGLAKE